MVRTDNSVALGFFHFLITLPLMLVVGFTFFITWPIIFLGLGIGVIFKGGE